MDILILSQKQSCNVAAVTSFTLQPPRYQTMTFDAQACTVISNAMGTGLVRSYYPSELPERSMAVKHSHPT